MSAPSVAVPDIKLALLEFWKRAPEYYKAGTGTMSNSVRLLHPKSAASLTRAA